MRQELKLGNYFSNPGRGDGSLDNVAAVEVLRGDKILDMWDVSSEKRSLG